MFFSFFHFFLFFKSTTAGFRCLHKQSKKEVACDEQKLGAGEGAE